MNDDHWMFLYYSQNFRGDIPGADVRVIWMTKEFYPDIQSAIQALFEDKAVMRVYELRQCYAIGRVRGE